MSLKAAAVAVVAALAVAVGGGVASANGANHSSTSSAQVHVLQPGDSGYFAPGFTAAGNPAKTVGP